MNTDDDVMWLRKVLTGHDPAIPGRAVRASPPRQRNPRRPARWGGAALAAAAVVTAVVIPVTLSQDARTATPAAANSSSSVAAQPVPAPRPGYDHLRWQEFDGTALTTTTQWWWNGVSGRELKIDKAGKVVSDVTLALPPVSSPTGNGSPSEAAATLAPTRGVDHMADNFPGTVPTTAQQLQSYLEMGFADVPDLMIQRVPGLIFQRVVNSSQMGFLVSILTSLSMTEPATNTVAPDGRRVQVLHPQRTTDMDADFPVLDQSGTSIVGVKSTSDGRTYWRLLSLSEISTSMQ